MLRKLTVLVLLLTVSGLAQSKKNTTDVPSATLMQKILDAWTSGDFSNAAPFYDKAPDDVFYDITPLAYTGWESYIHGVPAALAGVASVKFTVNEDAKIHRDGRWAWGTATWSLNGKMKDGNALELTGRWTCIWQNKGGKWLIVHEHLSVPWVPEQGDMRNK